jgi:hypothetical protein
MIPERRIGETIAFLRMAAIQLRHLAEDAELSLAENMRHIAQQCDQEAYEISRADEGPKVA